MGAMLERLRRSPDGRPISPTGEVESLRDDREFAVAAALLAPNWRSAWMDLDRIDKRLIDAITRALRGR
jgi:hypothetical protein